MQFDRHTREIIRFLRQQFSDDLERAKEDYSDKNRRALLKIANRIAQNLAVMTIEVEDEALRRDLCFCITRATMVVDRLNSSHGELSDSLDWLADYLVDYLHEFGD